MADSPECGNASSGLPVLLVDDDALLAATLAEILRAEGCHVDLAGDGDAALAKHRQAQQAGRPYALVLTDLAMPGRDGRALAADIAASGAGTAVALLSGWGRLADTDGRPPPGVHHLLAKPPRLAELRALLAAVRHELPRSSG